MRYAEFNGGVHFLCFRLETPFWINLVQKIFYVLDWRQNTLFGGKIGPKNQNCELKAEIGLKFWAEILYAEYNGGVHFFCFIPETPFLGNLAQKIKTVSLS